MKVLKANAFSFSPGLKREITISEFSMIFISITVMRNIIE